MVRKCALIARVSDPKQALVKEGSIPTQLDMMRAHINYKNSLKDEASDSWEEAGTYLLEGISGSKSVQSDEFMNLYRDIENGTVNTILCSRLDRVSRSVKDFMDFFDFLKANGVEFVSVTQQIDTTSVYGRFITFILMALAELEREQTSERMKVSKKARAEKGRWTGGVPPLGYDLSPARGELVVNPEEAVLVEQIFSKYLELGSLRKTAEFLNSMGYRLKARVSRTGNVGGGGKFKLENLRRILRSKEYIGILPINKGKMLKGQDDLDEHERYSEAEASWDPIVDEELFYEVQDLLDKGRVSGHNAVAPARHVYLLSGLLYCGECFEKMNAMSAKKSSEKRYHWYTCANQECSVGTIQADRIEKAVIDTLTELAFKREVLTAIIDEANARLAADIPRLKKELKARQNSLRKVSDRIRTLIYSHAEVDGDAQKLIAEELGKHSKRKVELETSIAGLEGRIAGCSSNRVVTEAVVAVLDRFTSSIRVLNPFERKKLLESVLAKVYWDGKNGLRIGMHGNHALGASEVLTGNGKFAGRHAWRLVKDLNLRPSG